MRCGPALIAVCAMSLAACVDLPETRTPRDLPGPDAPVLASGPKSALPPDPRTLARNFVAVVNAVEPVAEQQCRQRAAASNCDFRILVDDRPGLQPNAFQTVDDAGRPIIVFTLGLIASTWNQDELAFVLAHEAAHHIAGHLDRQQRNAAVGAVVFGGIAGVAGLGDQGAIDAAANLGAALGARSYSREFELEADALGTVITHLAGFDPVLGAQFFFRIPDPGDDFLGTHPANADRIALVNQVAAGL